MAAEGTPTLYEWAGGAEAFDRLTVRFYERVRADEIVGALFADMPDDHPHHVALWLAEVFHGPTTYSERHGGYHHMLAMHLGKGITPEQRRQWVNLLSAAADDVGMPGDPEFRSALMAYAEWGSRLALENSQPGADPPREAPMPHWGWGEAPPYTPG